MALTEGASYVLTDPEGLGQGVGALAPGQQVILASIHRKAEAGVGGDVVVEFISEESVEVDGETVHPLRRLALGLKDFTSKFELEGEN